MARARNIKPGFFSNDELVELPFEGRLLFIGLWTIADRAGRLLDRPKKIKMDLFPADNVDIEMLLQGLAERGFIWRYEVADMRCIQVVNWDKHQNPHVKEVASMLPEPDERRTDTMRAPCKHSASTVQVPEIPERAGLIPDSLNLIPDSGYLIADTGLMIPDSLQEQPPATADAAASGKKPSRRKATQPAEAPNPLNLDTWKAYKSAYTERYSIAPVQNAKSNSIIKQIVQALGQEAPPIAAFYVMHNDRNYVAKMHQLNLLLADHAKVRTEWATNVMMTQAQAIQSDSTATNLNVFGPMIAAARALEAEEERKRHAEQQNT